MCIHCSGNVFTESFHSSGRLFLLIKNMPPNNGRRSVVSQPLPTNECFRAVCKQRLFLWLHSSFFEHICHRPNIDPCARPSLLGSPRLYWNNCILSWTSLIDLICCCLEYSTNITSSPYPRTASNTGNPSVSSSLTCRRISLEDKSLV
jgi:hypothetical protein